MKITAKYLLVALLACAGNAIHANYEHEYAGESRGNCCFGGCYECGCNPLYCGAWDLQIDAGANFIKWRNRGDSYAVDFVGSVLTIAPVPTFKDLFKTPWTVGGQVGYHWSDNTRVYLEFNYSQAKGKTFEVPIINLRKYKLFDAYVGARYYWDRWCDRVSFFLGGKVGLTHHQKTHADLAAGTTPTILTPDVAFLGSNTVVSGGADFGFDICFCGNWSFVIQGAVIASCGPHFNSISVPTNDFTDVSRIIYTGICYDQARCSCC